MSKRKVKAATNDGSSAASAASAADKPKRERKQAAPQHARSGSLVQANGKPLSDMQLAVHSLQRVLQAGPVTIEQLAAKMVADGCSEALAKRCINHQLPIEMADPKRCTRKKARVEKRGDRYHWIASGAPAYRTSEADGVTQRQFVTVDEPTSK